MLQGAVNLWAQLTGVCSQGAGCCAFREGGTYVGALPCVPVSSPELEQSSPSLFAVCMTLCCVYHKGKESGLDKACCSL